MIKKIIKRLFKSFGKRITNYNAPAKPFAEGMLFLKDINQIPSWIIDVGTADGTPDITDTFPYGDYKYLLIDPAPGFYDYLEECKKNFPDTIITESCFCGEKKGVVRLNINKTGHYSSRYVNTGRKESIEVPMFTLDELTAKHRITGPILLKIDVEGAELDVLQGAQSTLKMCNIVVLETWLNGSDIDAGCSFAEVVSFMSEHDFVVFDFFGGHTNKTGITRHVDTVFVKNTNPVRRMG